jgi:transposase
LSDAGFEHSVLSEHRERLIAGSAEHQLLDQMLARFQARGLIKERGAQHQCGDDGSH